MLSDLRIRLRGLFRRHVVEDELDEELRFHFENEIEKLRAAGMSLDEATREARLRIGGAAQIKEDCRKARGTNLLEETLQDVRYGVRAFRKNFGFFTLAALTLALGIGASTAVFSLVNAILLKPLPYPNASRVVMPWRMAPIGGFFSGTDKFPWDPRELRLFLQTSTAFQHLGAFKKESFNLKSVDGDPQLLEGVRASAGFFPALGVPPLLGRPFTAEEDTPGHERVVVLSHRLWQSRFRANAAVLGTVVDLNGYPYTVIGVMPASFIFPNQEGMPASLDLPKETQLWTPLALPASPRGANEFGIVGYLKPGVTLSQVRQDMNVFEKRLEEQFPQEKGWFSLAVPLTEQTVTDARRPLLLFLAAVGVVLLIACSNVAGLLLNRSLGRNREFAMRAALGAGRGRLIRQLLTESFLLAGAGGMLGILLGQVALHLVRVFGPQAIPQLHEAGLDVRVLAYALAVTFVTGMLFGLVPALTATRVNLAEALKKGGKRSGGSAAATKIRSTLVIAQVALALVLVVAAGLLLRTFSYMLHAEAGFNATRVLTFELPLPSSKYTDTYRMMQLYQQVLLRLRSVAGIESAGLASVVPMGGSTDSSVLRIPEHPVTNGSEKPYSNYSFVSPGYFATVGTPLLRGRDITDADGLKSLPVTVINNAMAKKYWRGEDPIGKQVGVNLVRFPARTIVGIVADIKHASLREAPAPEMFVPYTQNEIRVWPSMQTMQFAVKTHADPASMTARMRQAVHAVDPDLPLAKLATLTSLVDSSMTADRFALLLMAVFATLALLLASIGMYGVIFHSVLQRTSEIGVRLAIGARRSQIFVMVLGDATRLAGAGIIIGIFAALATTRLMTRFLYGIAPTDLVTFSIVSLVLMLAVLLACYVPAKRATKVDPIIALRYE